MSRTTSSARLLLIWILFIATVSCGRDTCTGGLNISAPHLDGGIYTDTGNRRFEFRGPRVLGGAPVSRKLLRASFFQ